MVPEVVEHQVKVIGEQRPERIIEVDREAVGVTQYEAGSGWIAVTAYRYNGPVVKPDVTD